MSKFHSNTPKKEIEELIKRKNTRIHFVGALGVGMRPLMKLSRELLHTVSGSDREGGTEYERLISEGYDIKLSHSAENARGAELLVYSLAVDCENPELKYAEESGIPAVSRAEYLGALLESYKIRIGVSGSHGKSTTSAMIDKILTSAGCKPTTVIGANLADTASPLRIGEKDYFIYEACEYKDSFLYFSPNLAVFTNLELEHVDYFENLERIKDSFLKAINLSKTAVINADDENLISLLPMAKTNMVTFGESEDADYRGIISPLENGKWSVKIRYGRNEGAEIKLSVIGRHNAKNALAAASAALCLGIPYERVKSALESFSGIERRLEIIGERGGAKIYYDYAHHPTEIKNAIESVKNVTRGRVAVIFKPHTYSRTSAFLDEFSSSLSLADKIYLCEISAIRENNTKNVTSRELVEMIGDRAAFLDDEKNVEKIIDREKFSAIIIMGAANLDCIKNLLTKQV